MSHKILRSALLLFVLLALCRYCAAQDEPPAPEDAQLAGQQLAQAAPSSSAAQAAPAAASADTTQAAPASAVPAAPAPSTVTSPDVDPDRNVSWPRLFPNIWHDQKPIWLFPVSVARGHHLVPTISVVALTTGLIVADRYDTAYFHRTQTFNHFDKVFSGQNTALFIWAFPLGFDFASWLGKDHYGERTAVLSGEAVIDSEILTAVMKDIDRRWRPWEASTQGNGTYTDTWFKTHGSYLGGSGNFPSGHMVAAFAVATVFADRYPKPAWHRWLAFGIASAIGFSRISLQSHFPSDVFLGAVLSYSIAHFVVLRR